MVGSQPTSFALWASLLKDWEVLPPAAAEDPWRVRTDGLEMPLPEPEVVREGRLETDKALPALLGLRAALIEAKLGYEMAGAVRPEDAFFLQRLALQAVTPSAETGAGEVRHN